MYPEIETYLGTQIIETQVIKSGWAGEIIVLKLQTGQEYVVKTYKNSLNGLQLIRQEWQGLEFLYQAGYPVPKPVLTGFTSEPPYFLIEKIDGQTLWDVYQAVDSGQQQELLTRFTRTLFQLHQLDPAITGEPLAIDFVSAELDQIQTLSNDHQLDDFTEPLSWLRRHRAYLTPWRLSILHRDYHPWNTLVNKNGVIYVLDWNWGIGDPRFDLAWVCTLMERGGFESFSQRVWHEYQNLNGGEIQNVDYFRALATLRWLANVSFSLKKGLGNETRRAEFRDFILPLIAKGWQTVHRIIR